MLFTYFIFHNFPDGWFFFQCCCGCCCCCVNISPVAGNDDEIDNDMVMMIDWLRYQHKGDICVAGSWLDCISISSRFWITHGRMLMLMEALVKSTFHRMSQIEITFSICFDLIRFSFLICYYSLTFRDNLMHECFLFNAKAFVCI